jgi:hypothetical protein
MLNSLLVTQMLDEVLFSDFVGRVNNWTLVGAVLFIESLDQGRARAIGVDC